MSPHPTNASHEIHLLPVQNLAARRLAFVIMSLAPFLFGLLAVRLGQDANWDFRNYHWYNAYAFLNGRYGFDLLPSQTPYFYNPTLDVPFFLLATHVPAIVAGYVLGWVQGLNFVLLFLLAYAVIPIAESKHKVLACAVLSGTGMLGGEGMAELGTSFYDNVTSLGLFTSALLVVRYHRFLLKAPIVRAAGLAIVFGIPAGLMMGLKLPCVIFCVGLCFAFLFSDGDLYRRCALTFGFGIGVLVGLGISLGHWAWFLQSHFGNPLFPYFNNIFESPFAPLTSARDTQFLAHGLREKLLFPLIFSADFYRVGEIPLRDWRVLILYMTMIGGAIAMIARRLPLPNFPARYLLIAAALSYAAWLQMFCIYRYAVPLEMIAPLLVAVLAGLMPMTEKSRFILIGTLLAVMVVSTQAGNWHRRATWSERFVETQIPPLGDTSNLMILMAGYEPFSHIVPQFPPDIPFIRIQSNFASPEQNKGINAMMWARLNAHKGRFMVIIPHWQHKMADDALGYFQLRADWQACQKVTDRLYDDAVLDLCPVTRIHE